MQDDVKSGKSVPHWARRLPLLSVPMRTFSVRRLVMRAPRWPPSAGGMLESASDGPMGGEGWGDKIIGRVSRLSVAAPPASPRAWKRGCWWGKLLRSCAPAGDVLVFVVDRCRSALQESSGADRMKDRDGRGCHRPNDKTFTVPG